MFIPNYKHKQLQLVALLISLAMFIVLFTGCLPKIEKSAVTSSRPTIRQNTVCTSQGTPLRGTIISTEDNEPGTFLITPEQMEDLANSGLNALHIYVEKESDGNPVGASAENCDYLIDLAAQNNMYVVITMGEMRSDPENFAKDVQFLYEFWNFYAERYADRENVIFEICNEVPLIENIAEVQANAYQIIRKHAPDTMVLFYSLAVTDWMDFIFDCLEETELLIDEEDLWQNAAMAFHGYESQEDRMGADHFRFVIHTFTRAGYPIINTELPNRFELSNYPDTELLRVCEEEGISWLSFVFWERILTDTFWKGQLDAAGITWQPDQGEWPVTDTLYPFAFHSVFDTVGISPAGYVQEYRTISYALQDEDYIDIHLLNFGAREPISVTILVKMEGDGLLNLHLGSIQGPLLASCEISDTFGEYVEITTYLQTPVSGVKDIYFVFDSQNGMLYFSDWRFDLPLQQSYDNPYSTVVFAANYPFHIGEVVRQLNTDPLSQAPLQVGGITNGTTLIYDFVAFQGRDVYLHIRAKPLAGGEISIIAGDNVAEFYELGICEIDGSTGQWQEYSCLLNQSTLLMFDPVIQRWNLQFLFSGDVQGELFEISEFWFSYE